MATHTGDEGSISRAGVALTEVLSWSMSGASVGIIEDTAKGDVVMTFKPGRKNPGTVTVRGMIDLSGTAQNAWWDEVTDGTAAAASTFQCIVSSGKTFTFQAIPTSAEAESPEGDGVATINLAAQISATITTAWV